MTFSDIPDGVSVYLDANILVYGQRGTPTSMRCRV
jgi:hypothetical protein